MEFTLSPDEEKFLLLVRGLDDEDREKLEEKLNGAIEAITFE